MLLNLNYFYYLLIFIPIFFHVHTLLTRLAKLYFATFQLVYQENIVHRAFFDDSG